MRLLGLAALTSLAACAVEDPDLAQLDQESFHHHGLRIAWLGNVPGNAYDDAILNGARHVASQRHARVTPFYGNFDPAVQLEQCFDVVDSCHYDAILVIPTDPIGIIDCVTAAADRGMPVVATDLPIGPDLTTVEPQVEGQDGAVLVPAADWGIELASLVVQACAGQSSCEVAYIAGAFGIAFDDMALAQLADVEASFPEIHLVATGEAFYDRGLAASVAADMLAAHPDLDIVIGAGDQMAQGAEDAIVAAGQSPSAFRIIGAGAGGYAIGAVRAGRWYATYLALPRDEGKLGAHLAIDAARGYPIADPGINPVERRGLPPFFTQENADELATFVPQWPG